MLAEWPSKFRLDKHHYEPESIKSTWVRKFLFVLICNLRLLIRVTDMTKAYTAHIRVSNCRFFGCPRVLSSNSGHRSTLSAPPAAGNLTRRLRIVSWHYCIIYIEDYWLQLYSYIHSHSHTLAPNDTYDGESKRFYSCFNPKIYLIIPKSGL